MHRLENGLTVQPDPHVIAIADDVGEDLSDSLRARGFEVRELVNTKNPDDLINRLAGVHGVVTRTSSDFKDPRVIKESELVVIQGACKGPHVNIATAKETGVEVLKADANREEVAAVVNDALYGAATGSRIGAAQLRANNWDKKGAGRTIFPLRKSTLGVVGLGDVGQAVVESLNTEHPHLVRPTVGAVIAYNHGFEINRRWDDEMLEFARRHHVQRASSLDELFDHSSIVTLHVDVTDSLGNTNRGMISEDRLRAWGAKHQTPDGRPRAVFVNIARGELAPDIHVLNQLLHEGVLHSAIVDAHPSHMEVKGGFKAPDPLHPGLHFTPHIGGSGDHIDEATASEVDETLSRWIKTGGHDGKSRIYVHQRMDTREVVTPGALLVRAVRTTAEGSDDALKHGIREAGFSLIHPGVTFSDRIPGTRKDIQFVPTVLAVNINGTSPAEACERIALSVDSNNAGGQKVVAIRFIPTTEEMREGVRAYTNKSTY